MEARQRVQLTGTNRSFGLIALVAKARRFRKDNSKSILLQKRSSPAWWPSARRSDPIPSRTRPSNASAPMVLCLKTRESRSSPGLQRTDHGRQRTENGKRTKARSRPASSSKILFTNNAPRPSRGRQNLFGSPDRKTENSFLRSPSSVLRPPIDAGWSSPVARQAHNLKAAGSNPAPATPFFP